MLDARKERNVCEGHACVFVICGSTLCVCISNALKVSLLYMFFISNVFFIGSGQKKTVFIDSPLLKTEMSVRERSHIYHEESLKLSIKKNGSRNIFHLMTERPVNEQSLSEVRQIVFLLH